MSQASRKTQIGRTLLIAIFAAIAMLPIYWNGVPVGNDQTQHFQFAATVYNSVMSGDIYPSFAAATNHGLGDYGLRFYPPLTYYALSAAFFVVRDWYFAGIICFSLIFFAGGIGIYLWAREEFAPPPALIAVILYIFAPYHLNQLYNNGLFAEFFATAIIPFCFLCLTRTTRNGRWIDVLGLAIAYSLLILTHLPMTIICSVAMGIYALLLIRKLNAVVIVFRLLLAVIAATSMTSFYWARWLPEIDWIAHSSPKYFSTTWDYRANFLLLPDHFLKYGEDVLNLWFADIFLVSTLLIAIPTVVYLFRKKIPASKFMLAIAAMLILTVFLTTPLSSLVWDNAGFLQKVQFPWRWLAIIVSFGAVFASVGIVRMSEDMKKSKNLLIPLGLGSVLVVFFSTAAFVTKGASFVSHQDLNRQMTTISESDSCECWLPVWAERKAFIQTEKVVAEDRTVEVISWTATVKTFRIEPGKPEPAAVAAFYYPRWQASINGRDVPVEMTDGGAISIAIPAEASDIKLAFREPAYVAAAKYASFATWLFVLVFTVILLIKSRKRLPPAAA